MHPLPGATKRLLLCHSERASANGLCDMVVRLGYEVTPVSSLASVVRAAAAGPEPAVVLIECPPGVDRLGGEVLETVSAVRRESSRSQIVLLMPSDADVEVCCQAIEAGVTGFVEVERGAVDEAMLARRLAEAEQRYSQLVTATEALHQAYPSDGTPIVGQSPAMARVMAEAGRAAQVSDAPVLIQGESGTGKQLVAEMIHRLDLKRRNHPFLTVNCASITGTLADSALFGHVRGAFTGATQVRAGYFRSCDGGTVLLDEVGDLEATLQPKLLRTLQNGVVLPVGSDLEVKVDVRVIAATNRPLTELVEQGKFRLDLYQRLNVILLELPPLRERPEDIEALVPFFVRKYQRYYGRTINRIDRRVYDFLSGCALDGNVRELENTIRRVLALKAEGDEILLTDIPETLRRERTCSPAEAVTREMIEHTCQMIERGQITLPEFIAECERQLLATSIRRSAGPAGELAKRLGLSRRTFYNKRRKYGL